MFVSTEEVRQMTGFDVTPEQIAQAQTIIEVHVGRTEPDIDSARDFALLGRAVAFQAVYMNTLGNTLYEQVDAQGITLGGANYNFRNNTDAPFIAPYAAKACKKLSWLRSRGVKTGRAGGPRESFRNWWTEA